MTVRQDLLTRIHKDYRCLDLSGLALLKCHLGRLKLDGLDIRILGILASDNVSRYSLAKLLTLAINCFVGNYINLEVLLKGNLLAVKLLDGH